MYKSSAVCLTLVVAALPACRDPAPASAEAGVEGGTAKPPGEPAPGSAADDGIKLDAGALTDVPLEVAAQHILVVYRGAKSAPTKVTRSKADAKKRIEEALSRVRAGEDFSSLVNAYSDDPGSVGRLGSVGKFKRDKMDKAFADAAFALKVDEVSGVVETPFGFHIIKRNQ